MPTPPVFPLRVFYDGACAVCAGEIAAYRRRDRAGRLIPVDIAAAGFAPARYGIPLQDFQYQLHAIDATGTVYRGVAAFRAIWQAFPDSTWFRLLAALVDLPLVRPLAGVGYRSFARLRPFLPGHRAACHSDRCRPGRR